MGLCNVRTCGRARVLGANYLTLTLTLTLTLPAFPCTACTAASCLPLLDTLSTSTAQQKHAQRIADAFSEAYPLLCDRFGEEVVERWVKEDPLSPVFLGVPHIYRLCYFFCHLPLCSICPERRTACSTLFVTAEIISSSPLNHNHNHKHNHNHNHNHTRMCALPQL